MIFTEEYINTQKIVYTLLNRPDGVDFIEIMRGLEIKSDKVKYPNSIFFFKDGLWYFELSTASGDLWCRYDKVWSVFTDKHNKVYSETKAFIQEMVKEHWLRNTEPWGTHSSSDFTEIEKDFIEDHFKVEPAVAGPHPNRDMGEIEKHLNVDCEVWHEPRKKELDEYFQGEIKPIPFGAKNFKAEVEVKKIEEHFKAGTNPLTIKALDNKTLDEHFKDKNLTKVSPKGSGGGFSQKVPKDEISSKSIDEHFKEKEIHAILDWKRSNEEHFRVEDHFKEVNPEAGVYCNTDELNLEKHFKEVNPRTKNKYKKNNPDEHFKNTQPAK
jgi:hypothetical protein